MTKFQRKIVYFIALIRYIISYILPFTEYYLETDFGFCLYIQKNVSTKLHIWDFPELKEPKEWYNDTYWYKRGLKKPRIRCLFNALFN